MSSASVRHFFVSDDDEVFRVPNTKFERLLRGSFEEKTDILDASIDEFKCKRL